MTRHSTAARAIAIVGLAALLAGCKTDREVVFSSQRPVEVEARWTLTPAGVGTDLQAALSLDLAPLIGPFAAFVPQNEVANMVGPDLEAALAEIARRVEGQH